MLNCHPGGIRIHPRYYTDVAHWRRFFNRTIILNVIHKSFRCRYNWIFYACCIYLYLVQYWFPTRSLFVISLYSYISKINNKQICFTQAFQDLISLIWFLSILVIIRLKRGVTAGEKYNNRHHFVLSHHFIIFSVVWNWFLIPVLFHLL